MYTDVETTPYETAKLIAPSIVEKPHVQDVPYSNNTVDDEEEYEVHEVVEESLSLEDQEKDLIKKALEKHRGKRKYAALELGISERTLYRKIKEYNLAE